MRRFLTICVSLSLLLLSSCSSTRYVPVTLVTPSLPEVSGEYALENLIEEPETVYDILQNSVIYEHQYYFWSEYALILYNYIEGVGTVFREEGE